MGTHVEAMLELRAAGAVTFDYGNNIRTQAKNAGVDRAFEIPIRARIYPPALLRGPRPFRWVALSAIPRTFTGPIASPRKCSRVMRRSPAGCPVARQRIQFQDCPPGSAGWATASAPSLPGDQRVGPLRRTEGPGL